MNRTLLACLIIALFVVVGIQGFYLYRLTERLDASTHLETEQTEFLSNDRLDPDPQPFPDPWDEMRRMQDRINRLFNNTFAHLDPEQPFNELFRDRDISPSLDLRDAGDRYILKLDLPGMESNYEDGVLTLNIKKKSAID